MSGDYNPHLGHSQREKSHIQKFRGWARSRGQTTTAHQLLDLIGDLETEQALGSTLAFLTKPETMRALRMWSGRPTLLPLLSLAEELAVSPPMARPLPAGAKTKVVFRGTLEEHYLSAQIASRLNSHLSPDDAVRLHRFRVWLFAIAYEALLAGFRSEGSLKTVCTQLRMGLEVQSLDSGNTKDAEEHLAKVRWFAKTAPSDASAMASFAQFTIALATKLDVNETNGDAGLVAAENALRRLTKGDYRLVDSPGASGPHGSVHFVARNQSPRPKPPSASSNQLAVESLDAHELPFDPTQSDCVLLEVKAEEPTPAPELHAVSRRLALQTQEDRQYLNISWTRLSPWEQQKLHTLVERGLSSTRHEEQLLAALTIVAIVTKLSMRALGHVRLSPRNGLNEADEDTVWTLDLHAGTLDRPASRHVKAAQRSPELIGWTHEVSEAWILQLSTALTTPMSQAWIQNPEAKSLADLFPGSAESAFNKWTKSSRDLWRVTSGFLTVSGEQQAFESTGDSTFARLLLNWPASSSTGPMAYPGWNRSQVANGLQTVERIHVDALVSIPDLVNAMGSRLNLIDEVIAREIRRANKRIAEIAVADDWVSFHNAFTTYCVTLLLITTGARPARSVFERLSHFDLQRSRVFLDDKASLEVLGDKCGRIIPLPSIAVTLVSDLYLKYLRCLHAQLASLEFPLAESLSSLLEPDEQPRLPLFFRLSHANPNEWLEVTEGGLKNRQIFDWPLPPNAFRHRMATALRQAGLDAELVDAHLGHAEAGAETYSDLSVRCWAQDESGWKDCIERALEPLQLTLPEIQFPRVSTAPPAGFPASTEVQPFGAEFRELRRKEAAKAARTEANQEFEAFKERTKVLSAVTPEEWEALRDSIVFDKDGHARSAALSRYAAFQEQLDRLYRDQGLTVSVRTWVLPQNPGKAAFGADALQALDRIDAIRATLNRVYLELDGAIPSRRTCTWICVVDLAVNSGITDPDVLACVAAARYERMALLVIKEDAYLELCPADRTIAEGPVKRYLVPPRALALLSALVKPSPAKVYQRSAPDAVASILLRGMRLDEGANIDRCLAWIRHWTDHYNCLHRPGLQVGALSGRISTYSLSRTDFVAATEGERLASMENPGETAHGATPSTTERDHHQTWLQKRDSPEKVGTFNARSLIASLRTTLGKFHDRRAGSMSTSPKSRSIKGQPKTKTKTYTRANAAADMREAIRNANADVPKNILLLADWTVYLLSKGAGKKKELEGSSVARYLGALSSGFLALSHSVDITEADQEEVTNFYQYVIDPVLTDTELDSEGSPKKAQQYVLDRLIEFHRYAERYGAVSPYWDEISDGLTNSAVSPGLVTPYEYRLALSRLCPEPNNSTPAPLQRAFFLLLTYRFGLRGAEATHLSARNWVELADAPVLIVDHRHIKLKTPGSRRKVPLISPLDEHERAIADGWFAFRRGSTDFSDKARLLVNVDGQSVDSDLSDLRTRVTAALRWATNNENLKLHHARHSLANLVGISLLTELPEGDLLWNHCAVGSDAYKIHVRTLLLSATKTTRRSTWAVSRLLGHSRRETTCASYLHFLLDWSGQAARRDAKVLFSGSPDRELDCVKYLDKDPRAPRPIGTSLSLIEPGYSRLNAGSAMAYLKSRSRGLSSSQAATGTFGRLSPETKTHLEEALGKIGARLVPAAADTNQQATESFARHIPKSRWPALLALARQCDRMRMGLPFTALNQVSSSMQLMLAKREHFVHLRALINCLNLSTNDIAIRTPVRPTKDMLEFLGSERLEGFLESPVQAGERRRIGSYESFDTDDPATYQHRFSVMVLASSGGGLTDGLDLMTLWTCLACADGSH